MVKNNRFIFVFFITLVYPIRINAANAVESKELSRAKKEMLRLLSLHLPKVLASMVMGYIPFWKEHPQLLTCLYKGEKNGWVRFNDYGDNWSIVYRDMGQKMTVCDPAADAPLSPLSLENQSCTYASAQYCTDDVVRSYGSKGAKIGFVSANNKVIFEEVKFKVDGLLQKDEAFGRFCAQLRRIKLPEQIEDEETLASFSNELPNRFSLDHEWDYLKDLLNDMSVGLVPNREDLVMGIGVYKICLIDPDTGSCIDKISYRQWSENPFKDNEIFSPSLITPLDKNRIRLFVGRTDLKIIDLDLSKITRNKTVEKGYYQVRSIPGISGIRKFLPCNNGNFVAMQGADTVTLLNIRSLDARQIFFVPESEKRGPDNENTIRCLASRANKLAIGTCNYTNVYEFDEKGRTVSWCTLPFRSTDIRFDTFGTQFVAVDCKRERRDPGNLYQVNLAHAPWKKPSIRERIADRLRDYEKQLHKDPNKLDILQDKSKRFRLGFCAD